MSRAARVRGILRLAQPPVRTFLPGAVWGFLSAGASVGLLARGARGAARMLGRAVAVGTAAACTQDTGVHPVRAAELAWREVPLPAGLAPVTLASSGPTLLVGARAAQRPVPRLLAGPTSADLREVRLTPRSPYAFEATWFSIATKGDRVEAVGGAEGRGRRLPCRCREETP